MVWRNLGLNPDLPDHWRTIYPLGQWACYIYMGLMWLLITLLITMLCSFSFQILELYTITTINLRSQCLRLEIFWVTTYSGTNSFKTVQAKFRKKFNFNKHPQKSQIYRCLHKFQTTGSVNNLNKKAENPRSDRKLTARCPDDVDVVRDSVRRNPKKSLQRRSQELGLSCAL